MRREKCNKDYDTSALKDEKLVGTDEDVKNLIKKKTELFKEKQQVRDEWSTLRREMREDARIDAFKEEMTKTVDKLNALPKVTYTEPLSTTEISAHEAILMLSDLHLGTECDNFYNKYNSQIACERLKKLTKDTIYYCRKNNIRKLNVVNLGDMIAGLIHTTIRLGQEFDVIEQVMMAAEYVAEMLVQLQKAAPEVIYRSVTDNHSRVMADKNEAVEKEQFSKLIDWFLEERLKDTGVRIIHDNLDDSLGEFELENGKTVMFAHGHLDNANQAFQNMVGATKKFVDYILLGHYHCEKVKSFQGSKVFVNGSIVGTEEYALNRRLFATPSQTLLIFDKADRNNVIDISINLTTK